MSETLLNNWPAKVVALLVAVSIWYVVRFNIDSGASKSSTDPNNFPVPGEGPAEIKETSNPVLLPPAPVPPVPIGVPGTNGE